LRRARADAPLPRNRIEISGPETLTGRGIAQIWAEVLGKPIRYGGDDTGPFEQQSAAHMPAAMAYDTSLMFRGFQRDGMLPGAGAVEALRAMLGHAPRTYRAFAEEMAAGWR
jgi:uncharacterized protein YbjT (DUF2867 family)